MKNRVFFFLTLAMVLSPALKAQNTSNFKFYGFIRDYAYVDTHESKVGTAELFYYMPLDNDNERMSYNFTAITSRLGVDVSGYEYNGMKVGAKIETDFYNGLSGITGTAVLRLRQAYMTLGWTGEDKTSTTLKIGQAWHPMAADMPDVISLNTGAPFGPFARTPLAQLDYKTSSPLSITAAAVWQMQFTSNGPEGSVANYMKYSGIPELYLGASYTTAKATVRAGLDFISIKPVAKSSDRMNAFTPFFYAQYKDGLFTAKFKTVFAEAGEHVNLNGGYGVAANGGYTPTRNSSSWLSLSYGKEWQGVLFAGYAKNFGTKEALAQDAAFPGYSSQLYFSKNSFSNMNSMWRLSPTVIRNLGKVALALEFDITSVQYGDYAVAGTKLVNAANGLADKNLHTRTNNRLTFMAKYTF